MCNKTCVEWKQYPFKFQVNKTTTTTMTMTQVAMCNRIKLESLARERGNAQSSQAQNSPPFPVWNIPPSCIVIPPKYSAKIWPISSTLWKGLKILSCNTVSVSYFSHLLSFLLYQSNQFPPILHRSQISRVNTSQWQERHTRSE